MSARPPELLLTPIVKPEPVYLSEEPKRELTDEEIDAMPPELPALSMSRTRKLPAPKKPTLHKV